MLLLGLFCFVQAYSAGRVNGAWLHTMCLVYNQEWFSCHALILDDLQPLQLGLGQSEEAKAVINYRQNEGLIQYEQDPLMHICTGYDFKHVDTFAGFTTHDMWSLPDNDLSKTIQRYLRLSSLLITLPSFSFRHLLSNGFVVDGAPEYTSFVWVELTIVLITPFVNSV